MQRRARRERATHTDTRRLRREINGQGRVRSVDAELAPLAHR